MRVLFLSELMTPSSPHQPCNLGSVNDPDSRPDPSGGSEVARIGVGAELAILMATWNGAAFLKQQLDSIARQTYQAWTLLTSDDSSTDTTVQILTATQAEWGDSRLRVIQRPHGGAVVNFLHLLLCAPHANYYALSDQDDVWEPNKLERALAWLSTVPSGVPALYCGRTRYIDEDDRVVGASPLFTRPPGFANALVQNIAGGNTMVFNRAAQELFFSGISDNLPVMHDHWMYMGVTGCGGVVHYDPVPTVRYRQHAGNLIGKNTGFRARATRLRALWDGRFKRWNEQNIAALAPLRDRLTPENRAVFDEFIRLRQLPPFDAGRALAKSGVHRQGRLENMMLRLATTLGRV